MSPNLKKRKSMRYYQSKHARTARNKAVAEMRSSLARGPQISEHDLLSFQSSHFGDKSRPVDWFVDADAALSFEPEDYEDDGLGYYEDGAKRTLTDEQIEFFRQSELLRLGKQSHPQHREMPSVSSTASPNPETLPLSTTSTTLFRSGSDSTIAEAMGSEQKQVSAAEQPSATRHKDTESQPMLRQDAGRNANTWKEHRSRFEVPYEQRNKRRWEQYVESSDETQGALTHRRMARELDDQVAEEFEMDY